MNDHAAMNQAAYNHDTENLLTALFCAAKSPYLAERQINAAARYHAHMRRMDGAGTPFSWLAVYALTSEKEYAALVGRVREEIQDLYEMDKLNEQEYTAFMGSDIPDDEEMEERAEALSEMHLRMVQSIEHKAYTIEGLWHLSQFEASRFDPEPAEELREELLRFARGGVRAHEAQGYVLYLADTWEGRFGDWAREIKMRPPHETAPRLNEGGLRAFLDNDA